MRKCFRLLMFLPSLLLLAVSCGDPVPPPAKEEAPVLKLDRSQIAVTATEATLNIVFSNADLCSYVLRQEDEAAPSMSTVLSGGIALEGSPYELKLSGLSEGTSYVLYVAAEGPGGQVMDSVGFTTLEPEPQPVDNHTLVFYMMGSGTGLESDMDANLNKVKEVARKVVSDNSNHIMVFYDRGNYTRLSEILIENDRTKEVLVREYNASASCSADPAFMKDVFSLIKDRTRSESYGLVLSSHGGGWIPSDMFDLYMAAASSSAAVSADIVAPCFFGQDGTRFMEIPELSEALSDFHTDYILFDACLMASVEALYDLRKNTDYIIASPIEVLSDGFPFKEIIPDLFLETHRLKDVCQDFMDFYYTRSGAISLIRTDALEALAGAVGSILAGAAGRQVNAAAIQGYEGMDPHIFYDLEQYMQALTSDKAQLDAFSAALSTAVLFHDHTVSFMSSYGRNPGSDIALNKSCGLSCYIRSDKFPQVYDEYLKTSWAKAVGLAH